MSEFEYTPEIEKAVAGLSPSNKLLAHILLMSLDSLDRIMTAKGYTRCRQVTPEDIRDCIENPEQYEQT